MDEEIDAIIGRITSRATHPGLAGLNDAVLMRIETERAARAGSWKMDMIAMVCALAIGLGGAATLTAPTSAQDRTLFSTVSRLAPSTLLEGGR